MYYVVGVGVLYFYVVVVWCDQGVVGQYVVVVVCFVDVELGQVIQVFGEVVGEVGRYVLGDDYFGIVCWQVEQYFFECFGVVGGGVEGDDFFGVEQWCCVFWWCWCVCCMVVQVGVGDGFEFGVDFFGIGLYVFGDVQLGFGDEVYCVQFQCVQGGFGIVFGE